jgi:hypothetical protein
MVSATAPFARNFEFDAFLFAPIGEERNGMALSVLSAIARLDVDPWREAASLKRLPVRAAIERLTQLLASLPNNQPIPVAPDTITRLIGLLPGTARDDAWSRPTPIGGDKSSAWLLALYFIFAILTMFAEQIAHRPDVQASNGGSAAPVAGVAEPPAAKKNDVRVLAP